MKSHENVSVNSDLPNHGIEKKCSNCVIKVTNCPSSQAPCWRCFNHSEWQSVPPTFDFYSTSSFRTISFLTDLTIQIAKFSSDDSISLEDQRILFSLQSVISKSINCRRFSCHD